MLPLPVGWQVTVMHVLSRFEGHHTRSGEEGSEALKLFVVQFINTLVVTLLVYADVPALKGVSERPPCP